MTYDKKSSTIKIASDDPKEFERDLFAHFAHVVDQVEKDRASGALPAKSPPANVPGGVRAALRDELLRSYQPREMPGQECFLCGQTGSLLSPHLVEYHHDSKYKKCVGLVPTSEARGRVRGLIPVCVNCAKRCTKCGLPVRTRWVERMVEQLRERAAHLTVSYGQGFCRHLHPVLTAQSYLKPLVKLSASALVPEEYEEARLSRQSDSTESPLDQFIYAMATLGSPRDPENLRRIGEDSMATFPDPYIAALEATTVIVDAVVVQSNGEHGLLAHLMQNNCMGVVSLFLEGRVDESSARRYFKHFNELPRRALGLRPEATARLPTFEQTIGMVRAKQTRSHPGDA